jgi:hypothetical protein
MKNKCNNINKCNTCSSYIKPGAPCVNCQNGTQCEEVYYSSCVIYNEDYLTCFGINPGDTLTTLIEKLLLYVFPECHTTTTTTVPVTTTTTCHCIETTTDYVLCNEC